MRNSNTRCVNRRLPPTLFSKVVTPMYRWIVAAVVGLSLAGGAQAAEDKHVAKVGDLRVLHVWTKATTNLARPADVFLEIENTGESDQLVAVAADIAAKAGMVGLAYKPGTVTSLSSVEIPARGRLVLDPDGMAIQLEGLKRPLKRGQDFQVWLTFEKAGSVTVTGEVMAANARRHDHSGHSH
jgi:copper(I)-binding protein